VNSLARYIEEIVEPTFEDFCKYGTGRHAFLACVAIYHAIDRVSYPKRPGNLRKDWARQSKAFKWVDMSAHHFKHVECDDERASVGKPGLPLSRLIAFDEPGHDMALRNFFFVMRDAMNFVHEQAISAPASPPVHSSGGRKSERAVRAPQRRDGP
jgi:hypothetical protein